MVTTTAPEAETASGGPGRNEAPIRPQVARIRRIGRFPAWTWIGPLLVTAVAGYLRFSRLHIPSGYVFDEVYYAKDAWNLLQHGVELDAEGTGPGFVVHPPLGKWAIALGQAVFGNNELGWRFSTAVAGTLAVLVVARLAQRMTGSTLLGCLAGLVLAVDGLAFVQSRTAMLDIFLMFFVLAAFGCLVVDRDVTLRRARIGVAAVGPPGMAAATASTAWAHRLRPWRLAAGVFLGAACATKWSGLYFLAAFGLLAAFWELGAARAAGVRRPFLDVVRRRTLPSAAYLLAVPAVVYTVSWTGWFLGDAETAYGHDKHVQPGQGPIAHAWAVFRGWLGYHGEAYRFHVGLDSPHPYMSQPWGWLLLLRPVSYFYSSPDGSCGAESCAREVLGVGTPVIWWGSIPLIVALLWLWVARRDWRAGAVLAGLAATLLPWFATPDRTMFLFYALPAVPFFALGYALCAHWLLGGRHASRDRRITGAVLVGSFTVLMVANFFYLYPVLAAKVLPYEDWQQRMVFRECTAAGKNVQTVPCWI